MPSGLPEEISVSMDHLREAHFRIHEMERTYHRADPFRWNLNAFLTALKPIPNLLKMELQNKSGFNAWKAEHFGPVTNDPLIRLFQGKRDAAVHRERLTLTSLGSIGLYQGGVRFAVGFNFSPDEDSDAAILRVLAAGDPFGLMMPDEDTMPCVRRFWRLPEHDGELVQLCSIAWLHMGGLISDVTEWLTGQRQEFNLTCRMPEAKLMFRLYDRESLRRELGGRPYCLLAPTMEVGLLNHNNGAKAPYNG